MAFIRQSALDSIADFEKRVPFMYVDSEENVTVGVGHLLEDAAAAKAFTFYRVRDSRLIPGTHTPEKRPALTAPVTPADIEEEYDFLDRHSATLRHVMGVYQKKYTTLEIGRDTMQAVYQADVARMVAGLRTIPEFQALDTFPPAAQEALLDMAFNMGWQKFRHGWPNFKKAVKNRDWLKAAEHSQRNTPGLQSRNEMVEGWLEDAAAWEQTSGGTGAVQPRLAPFVIP